MAGNTRKKKKAESFMDYSLLFIVIFLLAFGLIMVYSASSYESMLKFDDAGYYLKKQFFATVLGLGCMVVVTKIDYHWWAKIAKPAYLISAVLILLVLTPLGITANGARRWLNLGMSLQPAEVAKVGMIIFFADFICKAGKSIKTLKGFMITIGIAAPISLMIMTITSNLSSAIIIMGIAVAMVFVAVPDYKWFVAAGVTVIAAVAAVVMYASSVDVTSGSFRLGRVAAWLHPEAYSTDKAFQTLQALYAIGSGGIWGKGLGQSMQKRKFLPEAQNDMIFSIICEELGLFGAVAIILLFVVLIWCCMVIANKTVDRFGSLLVVGVMAHYAIQVILNIAVVTNTIPNTGITLPFISYGGTSSLFLLMEIGIVLNVSKSCR